MLLLALLLQSDPDWQIHEEIAAERMKAAAEFERAKQFAWARAEYLKVLRLEPDHKEAKEKLTAPPRSNQGKGAGLPAKREELLQSIANKAALKFRLKAKGLAEDENVVEARKAWGWVSLYAPGDPDARRALKISGKGADALDSIWGDGKWEEMLSKAGTGVDHKGFSHIEKKWGGTNPKLLTDNLVLEGVGLSAERLKNLARITEATVGFMRIALGNPIAKPRFHRFVFLVGEERYFRYIDDFCRETPEDKKRLKQVGGTHNPVFNEEVTWCYPRGEDWFEQVACHKVTEHLNAGWAGDWLHEGVGLLATQLLLKKVEMVCITAREGTDASKGPWSDPNHVDTKLREKVLTGTDDDLGMILNATLLTMTPSQLSKSLSLVRFLVLRQPLLFRAIVSAYSAEVKDPRKEVEKALGFSLEELDEFWRRWYLAK